MTPSPTPRFPRGPNPSPYQRPRVPLQPEHRRAMGWLVVAAWALVLLTVAVLIGIGLLALWHSVV